MNSTIVYINLKSNEAEANDGAGGNFEEMDQIWMGDHPTKLLVVPETMTSAAGQELAQQVTASLQWELWRVVDTRWGCDRLLVIPIYLQNGQRHVAAFHLDVVFGPCDRRESGPHRTHGAAVSAGELLLKREVSLRKHLLQELPQLEVSC
jgi:hypothetical protein